MNLRTLSLKTTRLALSAIAAVAVLSVTASAQLTLDDFSGKAYVKTLKNGQSDTHYEALPGGSPLGAARGTYFTQSGTYAQSSTLDVGNGICVVDSGFQNDSGLQISYGTNLKGDDVPMGLNLGAYSGLQLNFAGLVSFEGLIVVVEIYPSSGGYYASELVPQTNGNPFTITFPFTTFTNGNGSTLTQAEASDISYIIIVTEGGSTNSFGIASFQAY